MEELRGSAEERLKKRAVAISVEEELLLAPWSLSANFQGFKHGRWQLALRGPADPSGRGEAYSYTRLAPPEKPDKASAGASAGAEGGSGGAGYQAGAEAQKTLLPGTQVDLTVLLLCYR